MNGECKIGVKLKLTGIPQPRTSQNIKLDACRTDVEHMSLLCNLFLNRDIYNLFKLRCKNSHMH